MRRFLPLFLATLAAAPAGTDPPEAVDRLRLGFTYAMFVGVNENDARASIRALAATIAHESAIAADPTPQLYTDAADADAAVHAGQVDAVGLTALDFAAIQTHGHFDRFLFSMQGQEPTEDYVLLVHRSLGASHLDQLRDRRLVVVDGPRLSLAAPWLEVVLARAGLPDAATWFSRIERQPKASRALLDVFFQKTDACLTTQRAYATMAELNPQLGAQLHVIARSPPVIPSLFAIRTDLPAPIKEKVIRVFTSIDETAAGRQALTIFQVTRVAERPLSILAPTLQLLDEFHRLRPAGAGTPHPGEGRRPASIP